MRATASLHPALVSLAAILAGSPVAAAELPFAGKIDAVTVFPDAAIVTRKGSAEVPAGSHLLVLGNLPPRVDPASIRIEGVGAKGLTIGSVETRRKPALVQSSADIDTKLKTLRAEQMSVQGRIQAVEAELRAIDRFATVAPDNAGKDGKPIDLAIWKQAWSTIGEATASAQERLNPLRTRAQEIDLEIRAQEAARGRPQPGLQPQIEVTVAIQAEVATQADFTISYRVAGARWVPAYDALLDTGAGEAPPRLALVRRALVSQSTGEDWQDVTLTLSTARVTGGMGAPDLPAQTLNLYEPPPVVVYQDQMRGRSAPAPAAAPPMANARAEKAQAEPARREAAREAEARLDSGPFSTQFVAPGRATVTRDGAQRNVRLASTTLEPQLLVKIVPALDQTAYLSARVTGPDDVPLLGGEVSLLRDGVFVGKSRIGLTAPGEPVDLGFGPDDRIKVERVPVRARENDALTASSKFRLFDFRTSITSRQTRSVRVQVIDRIPVSDNTAVTVEQMKETTPPTEKQVGNARGVMGWSFDLKPGEKREIRTAWRVRWPAERELIESN